MRMRVLMLGWEFPPFFAGGVGTVCHALTKALIRRGDHVTYLMPKGPEELKDKNPFLNIRIANNEKHMPITLKQIDSLLGMPYDGEADYATRYRQYLDIMAEQGDTGKLYGKNLLLEVERFAQQAVAIALTEDFDVIHAHDWVTFQAGIAIKEATGKPLIVHVHITEFDKSGSIHANPHIYELERRGMMEADLVVAVSNFIKKSCVDKYYIPEDKIRVVHNSMDFDEAGLALKEHTIKPHDKLVLFLGRVTLQKGPDYFIDAAKKVAEFDPDVKFVMAGSGDMLPRMIEKAAEVGLGTKMLFPGFTSREQSDELFRAADVFVMPSVSEPFGLVPLEAMAQGTPTIISRQSGVSEVLTNTLKTDFWDINDLANKMIAALHYGTLHETLKHHGIIEIKGFSWDTPATECVRVYQEAIDKTRGRTGWHVSYGGQETLGVHVW